MKTLTFISFFLLATNVFALSMESLRQSERYATLAEFKELHTQRTITNKQNRRLKYKKSTTMNHDTFFKAQNRTRLLENSPTNHSTGEYQAKAKMKLDTFQERISPNISIDARPPGRGNH
ncbi:hypothetical protein GJV85_00065 [Sulfurimonas aquatica]|uniref:DUF1104 domain-containing protein n=1 Tax=Sulfurimonas aquatica TaxID=2672570 RepID=A0A975AXT5_9BACT|nr:hypothetical protein [Sulfurimonas aquatica]QSZ40576.1 hypothetical protein GJV85_00065 [Sulfurimonas aquatica]